MAATALDHMELVWIIMGWLPPLNGTTVVRISVVLYTYDAYLDPRHALIGHALANERLADLVLAAFLGR